MIPERCFCARCVPTTAKVVCSRCGEEVRRGQRAGVTAWWHRAEVDHQTILGHTMTRADHDRIEAALDEVRYKDDGTPYTTRQADFDRMKKAARDAANEADDAEPVEIPKPEVYATLIEKSDPRLPGGAKTLWNLAEKHGWSVRAAYSRGPRIHASLQTVLSISDYVQVKMALDGHDALAVGSWCDNKFNFAYVGTKAAGMTKTDSKTWKSLIKGETP